MRVDLRRTRGAKRGFVRRAVPAPQVEIPRQRGLELIERLRAAAERRRKDAVLRITLPYARRAPVDARNQRGAADVGQRQRLARACGRDVEGRSAGERFVDQRIE